MTACLHLNLPNFLNWHVGLAVHELGKARCWQKPPTIPVSCSTPSTAHSDAAMESQGREVRAKGASAPCWGDWSVRSQALTQASAWGHSLPWTPEEGLFSRVGGQKGKAKVAMFSTVWFHIIVIFSPEKGREWKSLFFVCLCGPWLSLCSNTVS